MHLISSTSFDTSDMDTSLDHHCSHPLCIASKAPFEAQVSNHDTRMESDEAVTLSFALQSVSEDEKTGHLSSSLDIPRSRTAADLYAVSLPLPSQLGAEESPTSGFCILERAATSDRILLSNAEPTLPAPDSTEPCTDDILSGTFPFLSLPGELRNLLYSSFIPQNQHLKLPLYTFAPRAQFSSQISTTSSQSVSENAYLWKPIHPSILRINSQIRHEVLAHFYEKNTFEVHSSSFSRFLEPISAQDRAALRSVVLKGHFYHVSDGPEEDDVRNAKLLWSLKLTRLTISAVVSLWNPETKATYDIKELTPEMFLARSGMASLLDVRGLHCCKVNLEASHMTRKTPELERWLRELEGVLEKALAGRVRAPVQEVAEVNMDAPVGIPSLPLESLVETDRMEIDWTEEL